MFKRNDLTSIIIIMVIVAIIIGSIGNLVYKNFKENIEDVRKSVIIEDAELLEYALETNDGFKVVLYGNGYSKEGIFFENFTAGDQYVHLSYTKEKYTRHERDIEDDEGNVVGTEEYFTWDWVSGGSKNASSITILEQDVNTSSATFLDSKSISLNDNMFNKGDVFWNYWYPRGYGDYEGNIRYNFSGVKNYQIYSIACNIKTTGFEAVSERTNMLVIIGTRQDMIDSLKASGILTIIITIAAILGINGYLFYRYYYCETGGRGYFN